MKKLAVVLVLVMAMCVILAGCDAVKNPFRDTAFFTERAVPVRTS